MPRGCGADYTWSGEDQKLSKDKQAVHALNRLTYGERQLEEVLVDFWMNHFDVFNGKGSVRMLLTSYERDAIRPHVLGRLRDLLLATARHPSFTSASRLADLGPVEHVFPGYRPAKQLGLLASS